MADAKTQQPPKEIKKKIGSTTYIVTSHFQKQGSTAMDKVCCLIDVSTKEENASRKTDFLTFSAKFGIIIVSKGTS